jgi:hypothetical protein
MKERNTALVSDIRKRKERYKESSIERENQGNVCVYIFLSDGMFC